MAIEDELYQEIILDHYRAAENRRVLDGATHSERGENPSCGDMLTLFVREESAGERRLAEVSYDGSGCAICCASANMLCEFLVGESWQGGRALYEQVRAMLTDEGAEVQFDGDREDLEAMSGVRKFPARIKCALLPWSAFYAILLKREERNV